MRAGKARVQHVLFLSAFLILAFTTMLFVSSSLLFFVKRSISGFTVAASVAVALAATWRTASSARVTPALWPAVALAGCAVFVSGCLGSYFYDVSWDGQAHHQEGVIQLARGWNPVSTELQTRQEFEKNLFLMENTAPKAVEIAEACIYAITNHIESAKIINFLLIFGTWFLAAAALCTFDAISAPHAIGLAALATFNPVVVSQSTTFYVDGHLACTLLCLIATLVLFWKTRTVAVAGLMSIVSIYFINIKFTAVVYFVVIAAGYLAVSVWQRRWGLFKAAAGVFALTFVFGVGVFGFNPYVLNTLHHGHPLYPFYPLLPRGDINSIYNERPEVFTPMNRMHKLADSLLAESTIDRDVRLKIPFSVTLEELRQMSYPDARLGGFGPLFGGTLILTSALALAGLTRITANRLIYAVCAIIVMSVLANPEPWWARYVPQLWLVPLLLVAFLDTGQSRHAIRWLRVVILALMVANTALIVGSNAYEQTRNTRNVAWQLRQLRDRSLEVEFREFRSNRIRLDEHHIHFVEVAHLSAPDAGWLAGSSTRFVIVQ